MATKFYGTGHRKTSIAKVVMVVLFDLNTA